jgi:hypothetical protein
MAIIKRGDTGQRLSSTLRINGAAYNLTGKDVTFIMRNNATGTVRTGEATVTGATAGTVQYAPTAEDVADVGHFSVEWEVQVAVDEVLTFPHNAYEKLQIIEDLNPP